MATLGELEVEDMDCSEDCLFTDPIGRVSPTAEGLGLVPPFAFTKLEALGLSWPMELIISQTPYQKTNAILLCTLYPQPVTMQSCTLPDRLSTFQELPWWHGYGGKGGNSFLNVPGQQDSQWLTWLFTLLLYLWEARKWCSSERVIEHRAAACSLNKSRLSFKPFLWWWFWLNRFSRLSSPEKIRTSIRERRYIIRRWSLTEKTRCVHGPH